MDGILYMPGQAISGISATFQGNHYFGIDAASLYLQNTGFHPSADYSALAGGNPFHHTASGLVE